MGKAFERRASAADGSQTMAEGAKYRLLYVPVDEKLKLELAEEADDLHEAEQIIKGFNEEEHHRRTGYRLVIAVHHSCTKNL
jgi:hypothetical protein